jgi:membrane-bound lytic murein transglycosylase D
LSTLPPSERISWSRHVIKPGESLSAIAQRYHIGIDALKQANNIRGNLIHTGTSLLIPTSRRPVNQYTLSMDSRRHQGLEKTGTGQKYIYTVQRGDTLWDIGQRYGLSVERLCAWNGIPASRTLRLGQKLTLWLAPDQEAPAVGKPAPAANGAMLARAQTTDTGQSVYTVQTGDNLWLIAKRFGMTVAQLMSLNNLVQGSLLRPGQKLNLLPVSYNNTATPDSTATHYTVQKGDNLWLIARKYGTTVQQLLQWNNLSDSERLQPGQTLVLYINEA